MTDEEKPSPMILRILMPNPGDMELINQDGGALALKPIFYGKESAGPHIQVVEGYEDEDKRFIVKKTISRYRIKLKLDGKLELKKA